MLPLFDVLTAWITNVGWTDHWPGVELEILDREHRRGETLSDEQRLELHELWQSLQPDDSPTGDEGSRPPKRKEAQE